MKGFQKYANILRFTLKPSYNILFRQPPSPLQHSTLTNLLLENKANKTTASNMNILQSCWVAMWLRFKVTSYRVELIAPKKLGAG